MKSLGKNTLYSLTGSAVTTLAQWVWICAIAKSATPELVGEWTLAFAVTAPVFICFQLKLRVVVLADVKGEFSWGEYFGTRFLGITLALLVCGAIAATYHPQTAGAVIVMIALMKAGESASDIVHGFQQSKLRFDLGALSQLLRGAFSTLAGVAVLHWANSLPRMAAVLASVYLLSFFFDLYLLRTRIPEGRFRPVFQSENVLRVFRRTWPLGLVTAIGSVQSNLPRYFLEGVASRAELGVFGALSYPLMAGNLAVAALAMAAIPDLSRDFVAQQYSRFRRKLGRMILSGAILGIGAITIAVTSGPAVLRLLYGDAFAAHGELFIWLSLAAALSWTYVFLGTALDTMRRFHVQPWIHVVGALTIACSSMLLVPGSQAKGAAQAMLMGGVVEALLYTWVVGRPLLRLRNAA